MFQFFFDLRERIINFFRDYSVLISESKYKEKYGEGLKIFKNNAWFNACFEFLVWITYSVLSCKLAATFSIFIV